MYEILITNDDGFEAIGLHTLANTIKQIPNTHVTLSYADKTFEIY